MKLKSSTQFFHPLGSVPLNMRTMHKKPHTHSSWIFGNSQYPKYITRRIVEWLNLSQFDHGLATGFTRPILDCFGPAVGDGVEIE